MKLAVLHGHLVFFRRPHRPRAWNRTGVFVLVQQKTSLLLSKPERFVLRLIILSLTKLTFSHKPKLSLYQISLVTLR